MSNQAVELKVLQDIEIKVIGNAFGVLIAAGGLLAGTMVSQRSFEYWPEDIMPLALLVFMGYRLVRNIIATITACQVVSNQPHPAVHREYVQPDQASFAQIPGPKSYTAEEVLDAVAKRIESQKEEAVKKNKMIN